jgi:hypothetical protein
VDQLDQPELKRSWEPSAMIGEHTDSSGEGLRKRQQVPGLGSLGALPQEF